MNVTSHNPISFSHLQSHNPSNITWCISPQLSDIGQTNKLNIIRRQNVLESLSFLLFSGGSKIVPSLGLAFLLVLDCDSGQVSEHIFHLNVSFVA